MRLHGQPVVKAVADELECLDRAAIPVAANAICDVTQSSLAMTATGSGRSTPAVAERRRCRAATNGALPSNTPHRGPVPWSVSAAPGARKPVRRSQSSRRMASRMASMVARLGLEACSRVRSCVLAWDGSGPASENASGSGIATCWLSVRTSSFPSASRTVASMTAWARPRRTHRASASTEALLDGRRW